MNFNIFSRLKIFSLIKSRLGRRFLFFMILVSTIPIILMGFVAISFLNSSHRHNIASLEKQILLQKEEEIQNFVEEVVSIFQISFNLSIEQLIVEEGGRTKYLIKKEDLDNVLNGIVKENQWIESVYFVDISGKIASFVNRHAGAEILDEGIISSDLARVPFWNRVIGGQDYFGPVNYTLSGSMIIIATPVRNVNGKIVAALIGEVSLKRVEQIIDRTMLGVSGYSFLVDGRGILFAHSVPGLFQKQLDLSFLVRIQNILAGQEQTGLKREDKFTSVFGQEVIAAGKKIPNLNWGIFVEWPTSDAEAIIETIMKQIVIFSFFSLVIVLLVIFLIISELIWPIRKLEEGVRAMGAGNFDYRVKIKTGDELEDLGGAFNLLGEALKQVQTLRNEFVFIAAHELRAPVTVIKGYLSMIAGGAMGRVPARIEEALVPINKAGEGLGKLVDDLLQVARSEAGKIEIKVKPVDLVEETKSVLAELKILADEKFIETIYNPQNDLPNILADQGKLREILKNLVDNAIKYTLGKGTITVNHEIKDKMLITHVRDTGIGITKENQLKLFEKFSRIKAEGTESIPGTGLGLWIIKQLVEKMNGKIWVVSERDNGSTFSFSLPIAIA
ncbi:sensor histidine kinase [Candidatus Falkowbacteria bacterium]|nr:sensor histidine kinase [Candidatus Falkowbacteria bacterium]